MKHIGCRGWKRARPNIFALLGVSNHGKVHCNAKGSVLALSPPPIVTISQYENTTLGELKISRPSTVIGPDYSFRVLLGVSVIKHVFENTLLIRISNEFVFRNFEVLRATLAGQVFLLHVCQKHCFSILSARLRVKLYLKL